MGLVISANATLGAFLQSAKPIEGTLGKLVIRVFYSFHKDQLLNSKSQAVIQNCIQQLCGGTLDISIEVLEHSSDDSETLHDALPSKLTELATSALM